MSSKREETPYYLIPGTYSIELEECAHLHARGGVFISQRANDFLRSAPQQTRAEFLNYRVNQGKDEEKALQDLGFLTPTAGEKPSVPLKRSPSVSFLGAYTLIISLPGGETEISVTTTGDQHGFLHFLLSDVSCDSVGIRTKSFSLHRSGIERVYEIIHEFVSSGSGRVFATAVCDLAVVWYTPDKELKAQERLP